MEKQQLLSEIKNALATGSINTAEIMQVLPKENLDNQAVKNTIVSRLNLAEIFYYIGGIIILLGVVILIAQNWSEFSYPMRVFVTFGIGLAFFVSAILLSQTTSLKKIGTVFFFISGILIPYGYFVIFDDKINYQTMDFYNTIIPLLCLIQFGLTQLVLKKDIFTLFNTIFGTWLFFGLSNNLISNNSSNFGDNFHLYQVILVGISYTLVAYYLRNSGKLFASLLNTFGIIGILGPGFILNVMASGQFGGPEASQIWLVLYPVLLAATIISSVYIKSSAFLFVGTVCLIGYIIRITSQYFSEALGWPLALIIMGMAIMGLGYLAFHLNRKYIKS
jgi:uncharacterized integral membrane protein